LVSRQGGESSLGKVFVNDINSKEFSCDITYIFKDSFLEKEPLFVTWDYENNKFKILGDLNNYKVGFYKF